ncbi:hypothetical protein ACQPW1_29825 [Nocardia sp. CA-128927]|uniref:hypothetical protein n=1 Tax=Nocardia sp. CA-128927 TaxID=3239975 RepID=UPI003D967A9F
MLVLAPDLGPLFAEVEEILRDALARVSVVPAPGLKYPGARAPKNLMLGSTSCRCGGTIPQPGELLSPNSAATHHGDGALPAPRHTV